MLGSWSRFLGFCLIFHLVISKVFCLECFKTKKALNEYGIDSSDVPDFGIPGTGRDVCAAESSCCTLPVQRELSLLARNSLQTVVAEHVRQVADSLEAQANHFNVFFRRLMNDSRVSLDSMFVRTYGVLYEQNSFVFTDLFAALERYYGDGQADLEAVMHHFFTTLYKHMFMVLNSQHRFDKDYLKCVAKHMEGLRPFGDVPTKLTQQLRRSFVATRTLLQALRHGAELSRSLKEVELPGSCSGIVTRMLECNKCQALPRLKPCNAMCGSVLHVCLSQYGVLDPEWQQYISRLTDLIGRLEGSFNIESVVSPINVKISDAIMNFQDNGYDVSQKVFDGCGNPKFRRRRKRRTVASQSSRRSSRSPDFGYEDSGASSLVHVLADLRDKLRPLTAFWNVLPSHVCSDRRLSAPASRLYNCWNGTHRGTYGSVEALFQLPGSVFVSDVVMRVRRQLELTSQRLQAAYNGQPVNWGDDNIVGSAEPTVSADSAADADDDDENADSTPARYPVDGSGADGEITNNGLSDDEDIDLFPAAGSGLGADQYPPGVDWIPPDFTTSPPPSLPDDSEPADRNVNAEPMSLARAVLIVARPAMLTWLGSLV